jgi:hypothetical protein
MYNLIVLCMVNNCGIIIIELLFVVYGIPSKLVQCRFPPCPALDFFYSRKTQTCTIMHKMV